jgi:hypothetical protein
MKQVYVVIISLFFILGVFNQNAFTKEHLDFLGNPDKYILHQNYPNPFNPSTILSYDLKTNAMVKLTVYNLVGQVIEVVVDEYQTEGYHEYSFDATRLPAGIYLYKLQVGAYSSVKRMTLVK